MGPQNPSCPFLFLQPEIRKLCYLSRELLDLALTGVPSLFSQCDLWCHCVISGVTAAEEPLL